MSIRTIVASIYTLLAAATLYMAIADPSNDPLAVIFAIPLAYPWFLVITWLDSQDQTLNLFLLTGCLLINAALMWWWASRKFKRDATT